MAKLLMGAPLSAGSAHDTVSELSPTSLTLTDSRRSGASARVSVPTGALATLSP